MGKKIEIELNNSLFEKLNQQAEAKSMKLEEYILLLIKGNEGIQEHKVKAYQEYIAKELENLLGKVKGKDGASNNQQPKSKVLIYSYKTYKQEMPNEIKEIVEFYKKKDWFYEDYFYLILDRKGIVGYMGLNPQNEDLPYGGYMFLYSLQLAKSHQSQQNFKYIAGFIHAIAKKEKYCSIDISSVSTNVDEKDLVSMGFKKFDTTSLLRGKVLLYDKCKDYEVFKLEKETLQLSDLLKRGYLSSGRMLPLGFLYRGWQKKESVLQIHLFSMKKELNNIEGAIVIEEVERGQERIHQYTLLVDSNVLFDEETLKKIYREAMGNLICQKAGKRVQLMVPEELLEEIKFIEKEGIKKIKWYRMMIV